MLYVLLLSSGLTRTTEHYAEEYKKHMNNSNPSKSPSLIIYFNFHN